MVLRGLRKLEALVQRRLYGIRSKNCPICKDTITAPYFRHEGMGYHLSCILSWINISHKFTDPITAKPYSDSELKRLDTIAREYEVDSCVYELKYDIHRIAEDDDIREHEERAEILSTLVDRDMLTLIELPGDTQIYGLVRNHFLRLFQQLTYTDVAEARCKISELIESNLGTVEHINRLLFEVFESIDDWDSELEIYDSEDELPDLVEMGVVPSSMSPVLNMLFNSLFVNHPHGSNSITIQIPDPSSPAAVEIVRLPSVLP